MVSPAVPLRVDAPDGSLDVVVALWTAFRGVDAADLAEVDRVLRPAGRLLVVHDYGRDDVSALHDPDAPEYRAWSRRDGPFLRMAAFRIRVVHCFWTFPSMDDARDPPGRVRRARRGGGGRASSGPRLTWNVAVYHRWRGGDGARGRRRRRVSLPAPPGA